jgi:hypothetical protein
MTFLALYKYVLTAAVRDRMILSLIVAFVVSISLSAFLGSAASLERGEFAITFAGYGLRIISMTGLCLFAVFYIRRSFDSKDIELLLSRPVSRTQIILCFSAALITLAIFTGIIQGMCLYVLSPGSFGMGTMLWTLSIIAENIIMINVALFFAMVLSSASAAMLSALGFYVLARMMGEILGIIFTGSSFAWAKPIEIIMKAISMVMPRLDLMGQSSWLVYGSDSSVSFGFIIAQCVVYTGLIVTAAVIDMARRKF